MNLTTTRPHDQRSAIWAPTGPNDRTRALLHTHTLITAANDDDDPGVRQGVMHVLVPASPTHDG